MSASDERIEARLAELRDYARKYSEWQGKRVKLDEFRKSKLAMLMKHYQKQGHASVNAQEREALADKEYIEVLDAIEEATRNAEMNRWELEIARMAVSIWQTRAANDRAEKKAYGNT